MLVNHDFFFHQNNFLTYRNQATFLKIFNVFQIFKKEEKEKKEEQETASHEDVDMDM